MLRATSTAASREDWVAMVLIFSPLQLRVDKIGGYLGCHGLSLTGVSKQLIHKGLACDAFQLALK
jgi:hypothetical protein